MFIDDIGKNRKAVSGIRDAREKPGTNSPGQVTDSSFSDSLRRHLDAGAASDASDGMCCNSIQVQRCSHMPSAAEVEVRRIPYSACDKVEVHVLEGYTLKARMDNGNGNSSVYVEMKDDDGDSKAWLFDRSVLCKESKSVAERIAYEVMEQYEQLL